MGGGGPVAVGSGHAATVPQFDALAPSSSWAGYTRHPWPVKLMERRAVKVAAAALVNKMARSAWATMARGEPYRATLPRIATWNTRSASRCWREQETISHEQRGKQSVPHAEAVLSRFVLISGCSGGGKSTSLDELARRGHQTGLEPGRRIVHDELARGGTALPGPLPGAASRAQWLG